jgi:S1-C subfamily serine protease
VDQPNGLAAKAKVEDVMRNNALFEEYQIKNIPTVLLTDAQGKPYALEVGYEQRVEDYSSHVIKLQQSRAERDLLLAAVKQKEGPAQLPAARAALEFLFRKKLIPYYQPLTDEWFQLARRKDGKNALGEFEYFFEFDWMWQLMRTNTADAGALLGQVKRLEEWKKECRFKDSDRGARVHLLAGQLLLKAGKEEEALTYFRNGQAFKPTDPGIRQRLALLVGAVGPSVVGTGFAVTSDGAILTNCHVIDGPEQVLVRRAGQKVSLPAKIAAQDDVRDLALLKIDVSQDAPLAPLALANLRKLKRGEEVAAWGYPLGEILGVGVKLTKGLISVPPEEDLDNQVLLDLRVNPGNSGGPLCDAYASVVGMVTAKTFASATVESYGKAIPAADLLDFVRRNIKEYKPAASNVDRMPWVDVNHIVEPSVVMILKAPVSWKEKANPAAGK